MNTRTKYRNCCKKIFNEYLLSIDKEEFLDNCENQYYEEHPFILDYLLFESRETLIPYETKYENSNNRYSNLSNKEKEEIKNEYYKYHGYREQIEEKLFKAKN